MFEKYQNKKKEDIIEDHIFFFHWFLNEGRVFFKMDLNKTKKMSKKLVLVWISF